MKTSMNISWKHPEDDGGSPLTGYLIEQKESKRQYWNKVQQVSATVTSFNIQNLRANTEYDYRISAVNKIGYSEPLVSDVSTMAKSPFGEYIKALRWILYGYYFAIKIILCKYKLKFISAALY